MYSREKMLSELRKKLRRVQNSDTVFQFNDHVRFLHPERNLSDLRARRYWRHGIVVGLGGQSTPTEEIQIVQIYPLDLGKDEDYTVFRNAREVTLVERLPMSTARMLLNRQRVENADAN